MKFEESTEVNKDMLQGDSYVNKMYYKGDHLWSVTSLTTHYSSIRNCGVDLDGAPARGSKQRETKECL